MYNYYLLIHIFFSGDIEALSSKDIAGIECLGAASEVPDSYMPVEPAAVRSGTPVPTPDTTGGPLWPGMYYFTFHNMSKFILTAESPLFLLNSAWS